MKRKKLLALLICLVMVFGMLPTTIFAADDEVYSYDYPVGINTLGRILTLPYRLTDSNNKYLARCIYTNTINGLGIGNIGATTDFTFYNAEDEQGDNRNVYVFSVDGDKFRHQQVADMSSCVYFEQKGSNYYIYTWEDNNSNGTIDKGEKFYINITDRNNGKAEFSSKNKTEWVVSVGSDGKSFTILENKSKKWYLTMTKNGLSLTKTKGSVNAYYVLESGYGIATFIDPDSIKKIAFWKEFYFPSAQGSGFFGYTLNQYAPGSGSSYHDIYDPNHAWNFIGDLGTDYYQPGQNTTQFSGQRVTFYANYTHKISYQCLTGDTDISSEVRVVYGNVAGGYSNLSSGSSLRYGAWIAVYYPTANVSGYQYVINSVTYKDSAGTSHDLSFTAQDNGTIAVFNMPNYDIDVTIHAARTNAPVSKRTIYTYVGYATPPGGISELYLGETERTFNGGTTISLTATEDQFDSNGNYIPPIEIFPFDSTRPNTDNLDYTYEYQWYMKSGNTVTKLEGKTSSTITYTLPSSDTNCDLQFYCEVKRIRSINGEKSAAYESEKATVHVHAHSPSEDWKSDETCHYHTCTVCGEKLDCTAHDATTVSGSESEIWSANETTHWQTCATRGAQFNSGEHSKSEKWAYNSTSHWHPCEVCGSYYKYDEENHAPSDWVIVTLAKDPSEASVATKTCSICQATYAYRLCIHKSTKRVNEVAPTCTADGNYDLVCDFCGITVEENVTNPATGHFYSEDWKSDETSHWHECSCGAKADSAGHIPGAPATMTTPQTCTECGYVLAPAIEDTPAIHSVSTPASATANELFDVTVIAASDVTDIRLYNAYGLSLGRKSVTVTDNEDGTNTWVITTALGTAGNEREIKAVVQESAGHLTGNEASAFINILPAPSVPPVIESFDLPEVAAVNQEFSFTAVTDTAAVKLIIQNEFGAGMGIVSISFKDVDGRRIWSGTMKVGTRGNRTFTVYAKNRSGDLSKAGASDTIVIQSVH